MLDKPFDPSRHTSKETSAVPEFSSILKSYNSMVAAYVASSGQEQQANYDLYGGLVGATFIYRRTLRIAEPAELSCRLMDDLPIKHSEFAESYFFGNLGLKIALGLSRGIQFELSEKQLKKILKDEHNEILYGAPGILLGLSLLESEGLFKDKDALKQISDHILYTLNHDDLIWTQIFPDFSVKCFGAAHGAIGNFHSLAIYARQSADKKLSNRIESFAVDFCEKHVVHLGPYANLQKFFEKDEFLVQWCHGAPGLITSLHSIFSGKAPNRLRPVIQALSATIVAAGPLTKAPSLCHGDAGNALALLAASEMLGSSELRAEANELFLNSLRRYKEFGPAQIGVWDGLGGLIWAEMCFRQGYSGLPFLDFLPRVHG